MTLEREELRSWAIQQNGDVSPELRAVLADAYGSALLDLRLIRDGSNLVLAAPSVSTVFRVHLPSAADEVQRNLELVRLLASLGAPILCPRPPYAANSQYAVATFWPLAEQVDVRNQFKLGQCISQLHGVEVPVTLLPRWNPQEKLMQRLSDLPQEIPADLSTSLVRHVEAAIAEAADYRSHKNVLLHGDAHIGNAVTLDGQFLLVDLDDLCLGPSEADLIPSLVAYQRFHHDDELWERFRAGYGPAEWESVARLAIVREATMNTWLAGLWPSSQGARLELARRIASWDDRATSSPWKPL